MRFNLANDTDDDDNDNNNNYNDYNTMIKTKRLKMATSVIDETAKLR